MDVDALKRSFKDLFKCECEYIIRCPGRVNLIGEHIDYSGYGVLPMAIDMSTYLLVSHGECSVIEIRNADKTYPDHVFAINEKWNGVNKPEWYDYILSGWKGVIDRYEMQPVGMNILVSGSIPPSAGLSSSSSLVCAAVMATLVISVGSTCELISKEDMAVLAAKAEHYVGTESGGMDHAIEILADVRHALLIEFNPLRSHVVQLPVSAHFAILHSGRTLNKAATSQYNERVAECRVAAKMIARAKGLEDWILIETLKQAADQLHKSPEEMLEIVKDILTLSIYSKKEILSAFGVSEHQFCTTMLATNTQQMEKFKLMQRARHVYSEALRVGKFRDACLAENLNDMGELMNESHQSCKIDYECSSEELDHLVRKCVEAGARGARLTGAGWGGCVVALFDRKIPDLDVLFWSHPADGMRLVPIN